MVDASVVTSLFHGQAGAGQPPHHQHGVLPGGPRGPAGRQGKRNRHSHRRRWQDSRRAGARGPGVRPGRGRGSLRHAHLFPCLGVTAAGTGQLASSHRPSICHDTPGKNTAKYCFFIPFITLTRLNPEVPLALSGEVPPCPWRPASPWHKSAVGAAPGPGGPACSGETVGTGGARPQGDLCPAVSTAPPLPHKGCHHADVKGLRGVASPCWVGPPLGNPEPEVSCFWASPRTRFKGGLSKSCAPLPPRAGVCPPLWWEPWPEDAVSKQSMKSETAL